MKTYLTKDSGKREEFGSGSVRDTREGKGRFDLLPPLALYRIAGVYERGATKYGDRNWEKGQPIMRYYDSAMRHMMNWLEGRDDEDHLAQAAWNLLGMLFTEEMIERKLYSHELNDKPDYRPMPQSPPAPSLQESLPFFEWRVGSRVGERDAVLRDLGFDNPKELRRLREEEDLNELVEDLERDPRVKAAMSEAMSVEMSRQIGLMQDQISAAAAGNHHRDLGDEGRDSVHDRDRLG